MRKTMLLFLTITMCVSLYHTAMAAQIVNLEAAEGNHQFPYFDQPTPVWEYNGQTPGPLIRAEVGTELQVNLDNKLQEPTTIHWHGLRIDNSMDGVPGVTQEAVQPGEKFLYRLQLEEAGTFWYHPHFNNSEQIERGLKGILIVEEKERLPWSQELILFLDDWRLTEDGTIYSKFNTPQDLMHDGRWGNAVTVNGKVRPEFHVRPGERVRLRLINGANARVFSPNLEGLSAHVIAVDGRPVTKIFELQNFQFSPGNRLDLDITIPDNAGGKSFTLLDRFPRESYPLAIIKVTDASPIETPAFQPKIAKQFLPADLFSNVAVTKTWDLNAFRGGKLGIGWGMNKRLWPESDKADFQLGVPQKIVFRNSSSRLHPMHIHGVFFRVLERNNIPAVEPFTRDTVLVGPKEEVVIGLVPEHKGIWVTHCHILEHAEAGMMTSIGVSDQGK
jgi:FtsP/CotA-like multicopper oxidase with cupredoxin domain